jgi:NTE family protein
MEIVDNPPLDTGASASAAQPDAPFERLSPEVLGTKSGDLIAPCDRPHPRPASPPLPDRLPAFAVALSGGGFRAALSGLGVLRFLADAGLLSRVRWVSSVSGGSIANGLFATRYPRLREGGFSAEAFTELGERPLVEAVSARSLEGTLFRNVWRAIGPATRTTLLARYLDQWFYSGTLLRDLDPGCRFVFNAANLTTGVRFGFERDVIGDYVIGTVSTHDLPLRVADAVAASGALPGALAPYTPKATFPCRPELAPSLVDGGAYENTATEPIDGLDPDEACLVALNAGGIFRPGPLGGLPIIRDLTASESLLYRQSTALRMRYLVERFQEWEQARAEHRPAPAGSRRGVLFGLATTMEAPEEWVSANGDYPADDIVRLSEVKTTLGQFPSDLCRDLIRRGWWLAGATLCAYHRELLPEEVPTWSG